MALNKKDLQFFHFLAHLPQKVGNLWYIGISLHDSYYLENNGPKSCYLSVKLACRIDKYRVDERITMIIGVRSNYEDFCMILL